MTSALFSPTNDGGGATVAEPSKKHRKLKLKDRDRRLLCWIDQSRHGLLKTLFRVGICGFAVQ